MFYSMMEGREHLTSDKNTFFIGAIDRDFISDDVFMIH